MADAIEVQREEEDFGLENLECYTAAPILDAKYEKVNIDDVIAEQSHLSESQQKDLKSLLEKHEKLFDGTLGVYPHKNVT